MASNLPMAPELPDTLKWINTEAPVSLSALRGKIVLLEFWTSGSVNCMHMLSDLRYLEHKYRDNLIVISIHSAKFPHNNNIANVKKSVARHHLKHPVAHDPSRRVCVKYGIHAWPAVVLIDAEGRVIGRLQGEGKTHQLDQQVKRCIEAGEKKDILDTSSYRFKMQPSRDDVLSFPGKLFATRKHIYISDSGHNRVLEVNQYGRVSRIFGSGGAGLLDGYGIDAAFNNPQGLVCIDNFLFVADCGNHAIRRINLANLEISTIAGNGKLGRVVSGTFTDPTAVPISSPWDLCYKDGTLYIAMAGRHQVWKLNLTENSLSVFSGSGAIELKDGKAEDAAFAQPSGLAMNDYKIYCCDAESSAIRLIRLPGGQVSTLIGKGLFTSGDCDSDSSKALLQHPQSIVMDQDRELLYIADSYNNKIKALDLNLNTVRTLFTGGELDEPGGLALCDNTLWITNTNAHEIRKLNLLNHEVEILELTIPEQ